MKIEMHEIAIGEIAEGYVDSDEEGVVGYGGRLNIRPKYQREFVYDEKKRNAVIDTITKNFPLNVMYWAKNDDGTFEIVDGQQRTVSFCRYVKGDFAFDYNSADYKYFHNLTAPEQKRFLDYKVLVYFCEGNDDERIKWFNTINIAGEVLTAQELLNASYPGEWLTHAKSIFSKTNCAAYRLAKDYVVGSPIRQELLETALSWISKGEIKKYMAEHQHFQNANELWTYFQSVINWVKLTFTTYRKEMRGINWGELYEKYGNVPVDTALMEKRVAELMLDDDVSNKKGIYNYVLSGKEKYLNIRAFTESQRRTAYERQGGVCPMCRAERREKIRYEIDEMEADHITPWRDGGKTSADNCQMLCKEHNRIKGGK